MKVYTYSSFDGSKVGFQMGTFKSDEEQSDGYYIPKPKEINSSVRKAFENGIIRRIYGKLPKDNSYVVMFKGIKNTADDTCITKYGNFAFEFKENEFDSYSKYRSFIKKQSPQEISEQINRFLKPDNSVENYAIKIDANKFKQFMNEVSKNDSSVVDADEQNFFYIETNYQNSDYTEKLNNIFGTSDIAPTKNKGVYTTNPKKKLSSKIKKFIPGIVGISAVIIIIWVIVKILKE